MTKKKLTRHRYPSDKYSNIATETRPVKLITSDAFMEEVYRIPLHGLKQSVSQNVSQYVNRDVGQGVGQGVNRATNHDANRDDTQDVTQDVTQDPTLSSLPGYHQEEKQLLKDLMSLTFYYDLAKEEINFIIFGVKLHFMLVKEDPKPCKFKEMVNKLLKHEIAFVGQNPNDDLAFVDTVKLLMHLTGVTNAIGISFDPSFTDLYNYVKYNKTMSQQIKYALSIEFAKCSIRREKMKGVSLPQILEFAIRVGGILFADYLMKFILQRATLINVLRSDIVVAPIETLTVFNENDRDKGEERNDYRKITTLNIHQYNRGVGILPNYLTRRMIDMFIVDETVDTAVLKCVGRRDIDDNVQYICSLYMIIPSPSELKL